MRNTTEWVIGTTSDGAIGITTEVGTLVTEWVRFAPGNYFSNGSIFYQNQIKTLRLQYR